MIWLKNNELTQEVANFAAAIFGLARQQIRKVSGDLWQTYRALILCTSDTYDNKDLRNETLTDQSQ